MHNRVIPISMCFPLNANTTKNTLIPQYARIIINITDYGKWYSSTVSRKLQANASSQNVFRKQRSSRFLAKLHSMRKHRSECQCKTGVRHWESWSSSLVIGFLDRTSNRSFGSHLVASPRELGDSLERYGSENSNPRDISYQKNVYMRVVMFIQIHSHPPFHATVLSTVQQYREREKERERSDISVLSAPAQRASLVLPDLDRKNFDANWDTLRSAGSLDYR